MSDSLGRLVLRAQGRMPVATPLLRSRYADEAGTAAGWGEEISEPAATPAQRPVTARSEADRLAPPARPETRTASPPTVAEVPVPARIPAPPRASQIASRDDRQQSAARIAARAADAPAAPDDPGVHPVSGPAANFADPLQEATAAAAPEHVAPEHLASVVPPPSPPAAIERHEQARAPMPSPLAETVHPAAALPRAAMPEVRISIGRVEVHAAPPQAAAPAPPTRLAQQRRPAVSLADYLAERGRAR